VIDAATLLSELIRIDTTNPPGRERDAVELIASVLADEGIDHQTYARDPERPSLVARVPGDGTAPPLLVQGHLDVVGVTDQRWDRDPFSGEIVDGWVWGRGALDMKGPIVMMLDALVRAKHGHPPAGDIILCLVPDEEDGGGFGAGFLVTEHPELFDGVEYALGEFGGFPFVFDGVRFSPIQISERVGVDFRITFRGEPGHASMPQPGGAMAKLGRALVNLDRKHLPVHLTPPTRLMLEAMAPHVSPPTRLAIRGLLDDRTAPATVAALRSRLGRMENLFRNTTTPTIVRGGDKINVIPAEVTLTLDGRMLPGLDPVTMRDELAEAIGVECDISFSTESSGIPAEPNMGLFDLLASAVRRMDPGLIPIPYMTPAITDARWFSKLGITCYGFTPMLLPVDFAFEATVHGANERIPVSALGPGSDAYLDVFQRHGRRSGA
jgi:acetylornithine deacetylase/succinyl-diaminopimelate desuccinylase-like protein